MDTSVHCMEGEHDRCYKFDCDCHCHDDPDLDPGIVEDDLVDDEEI